jgi:hypothetical protein
MLLGARNVLARLPSSPLHAPALRSSAACRRAPAAMTAALRWDSSGSLIPPPLVPGRPSLARVDRAAGAARGSGVGGPTGDDDARKAAEEAAVKCVCACVLRVQCRHAAWTVCVVWCR